MLHDALDHPLELEVRKGPASHGSVALHALRDDRGGDELVVGHLLLQLLVQVLVKEDGSIELLLLLPLRPLLLSQNSDEISSFHNALAGLGVHQCRQSL